jgi:CubicO group peptidase (beta-lactamase class C family)
MGAEDPSYRELMAAVRALGNKGLGVEGVHVHTRNRPPVEYHWVADIRRDIFSASKTFTSVAVAIAQGEGLLDVGDSILSHLGHLTSAPATGIEAITIRHLLTMTSGITYRWDDPDADHPGDAAIDILTTPLGAAPGAAFAYRGANTYLLSRIIHTCSGQDLRDFLLPRLFTPLSIRNPQWLRCPLGYSLGAVGLHLRTAEVARLGRTLLEGGRFLDQQLVPATSVTSMTADCVPTNGHVATGATAPHAENARYGRHVWLCHRDDAWRMDGLYGQFSVMLPRYQACVTTTAHYRGPTSDLLDAIWSDILPALN